MAVFEGKLPSQQELIPGVLQLGYMYGLLVANGPPHDRGPIERHPLADGRPSEFADGGPDAHHAVLGNNDIDELRFADAGRVLGNSFEHRRDITRRAGYHTQDIADCGLMLQRLAQVIGTLAQLVEQPRILDGDDSLVGEVLHQRDLLIGERPHLGAVDDEGADQLVLLEHRHCQMRPTAANRAAGVGHRLGGVVDGVAHASVVRSRRLKRTLGSDRIRRPAARGNRQARQATLSSSAGRNASS